MEYVVPCSTQSQFPYLWSALLQSAHWMPIHGDPGVHEMGIPSRNGAPREHNWEPPPPPPRSEPRPSPRRFAPPLEPSQLQRWPESTTGTPVPAPRHDPDRASWVGPAPGALRVLHQGSRWALPPRPFPGEALGPLSPTSARWNTRTSKSSQVVQWVKNLPEKQE